MLPAMEAQLLNHWTAREVPNHSLDAGSSGLVVLGELLFMPKSQFPHL